MRLFSTLPLLLLCAIAIGQDIAVQPFTAVQISGGIRAELVHADSPLMQITRPGRRDGKVTADVIDNVLHVSYNKAGRGHIRHAPSVKIYYTTLNSIRVSDGVSVSSDGIVATDQLTLDVSEGAAFQITVDAIELTCTAKNGAAVSLKGSAVKVDLQAQQGAAIDGSTLRALNATATAAAGGAVSIIAQESIRGEAAMGGSIRYGGDPKDNHLAKSSKSGGSITTF